MTDKVVMHPWSCVHKTLSTGLAIGATITVYGTAWREIDTVKRLLAKYHPELGVGFILETSEIDPFGPEGQTLEAYWVLIVVSKGPRHEVSRFVAECPLSAALEFAAQPPVNDKLHTILRDLLRSPPPEIFSETQPDTEFMTGWIDKDSGHRMVKIDGLAYRADHLAWFYTHGKWPQGDLEHIDGNRDNNALANLRLIPGEPLYS